MAKSFCNGCKHFKKIEGAREYNEYFLACVKFEVVKLEDRKKRCNGKYKKQ